MDKLKLYESQQTIKDHFNFSDCSIQILNPTTILVTIDKIEDKAVEDEFINKLKSEFPLIIDCEREGEYQDENKNKDRRAKVINAKKMVNEKFSNEEMATYTFIVSE